jgi:serine/threonine-protein kinase HipA
LQGSRNQDNKDDRTFFLLTQLAFFLLAAPDGHAKNFSIYLQRGDAYEMTPLYDILSMWPYFGDSNNRFKRRKAGLAMAIRSRNVHYHFHTIQARHWRQLALKNGGPAAWDAMLALAGGVKQALDLVESALPYDFPPSTWEAISTGMRSEAQRFLSEAGLLNNSTS